jgi:hypothetical protein
MTSYRRDPATGQLAQRIPTQADVHTGDAVPGSERWVVLFFQPGSGVAVRTVDDHEAATWTEVEVDEP